MYVCMYVCMYACKGAKCSFEVKRPLKVRWVVVSILHGGPAELFLVPATTPRHVCVHVCMCACVHACMCMCVCMCACMYVCMYTCMYVRT